jgi:hypothetical protein
MSIAKRNAIQSIQRLIPDDVLRDQLIDLHLGKLSEEQILQIREEREREAEMILQMFPKCEGDLVPNQTNIVMNVPEESTDTINGEPEKTDIRDSGNQDVIFINEVVKRDTA